MDKVYGRALKLCYQHNSSFDIFLEKQEELSIHQRNLKVLETEFYENKSGIAPPVMNSLF